MWEGEFFMTQCALRTAALNTQQMGTHFGPQQRLHKTNRNVARFFPSPPPHLRNNCSHNSGTL